MQSLGLICVLVGIIIMKSFCKYTLQLVNRDNYVIEYHLVRKGLSLGRRNAFNAMNFQMSNYTTGQVLHKF